MSRLIENPSIIDLPGFGEGWKGQVAPEALEMEFDGFARSWMNSVGW